MATSNSVLVTRPDHDVVTKYLCAWCEDMIALARQKSREVYDLKGNRANRDEFESYTGHRDPSFLFLNGHGNADVITGYNDQPLVDRTSRLVGMVVYARSCDAGQSLGPYLVHNGTKTFIGYKRKFVCGYLQEKVTRPREDSVARLFLDPSNLVVSTLIKGHTAEEAHRRSLDAMQRNFRKMISTAASYEERYAARWLWGNMSNQVLCGDPLGQI